MKSNLKILDQLERYAKTINPIINSEILEQSLKYESSLESFLEGLWHIIEGTRPFVSGWCVEAICEHLEALYSGQIKNLLINCPPRMSKSSLCSVAFPAWCWTKDPQLQFLYLSHNARLSIRDSTKCRRVIESPWYKKHWGHKFRLSVDTNNKIKFENNKSGYRIASSVFGSITGDGGDIIVVDDPNQAGTVESDVIRDSVNTWLDHSLTTRLNDQKTGRTLVIQQRFHPSDYSGHLISQDIPGLVHLMLPMEFESSRKCKTIVLPSTHGKPWEDPRKKDGELLCPERIGASELDILKIKMGSSYVVAGQFQQRPAPISGGMFKKEWWQLWKDKDKPRFEFIMQSWDTALSDEATACESCCTTWGLFRDKYNITNLMLISVFRGRLQFPELRRMAIRLSQCILDTRLDDPAPADYIWKPDCIVIEDKASGLSLIQELIRTGLTVNKFNPKMNGGSKIGRAHLITSLIESGRVWLPTRRPNYDKLVPWAEEFVEQCALFPRGGQDCVDSASQAIIKFRTSGLIDNIDDMRDPVSYREKKSLY